MSIDHQGVTKVLPRCYQGVTKVYVLVKLIDESRQVLVKLIRKKINMLDSDYGNTTETPNNTTETPNNTKVNQ
jgi:hypothetical protein